MLQSVVVVIVSDGDLEVWLEKTIQSYLSYLKANTNRISVYCDYGQRPGEILLDLLWFKNKTNSKNIEWDWMFL